MTLPRRWAWAAAETRQDGGRSHAGRQLAWRAAARSYSYGMRCGEPRARRGEAQTVDREMGHVRSHSLSADVVVPLRNL